MPYEIDNDPAACSTEEPFAVKKDDGEVVGCHISEEMARKQVAALEASESEGRAARVPEQRTIDVDVEDIDTRGRTLHGYAAVYDALSGDLGGFKEVIAPGAFAGVMDADVRCLLNHDPSQVLGRTKSGTMRLADEQRGLRFECDLPDSPLGENVRAAVKRGDIDGASFRFVVGEESWSGDLRTVKTVKQLHDCSVATFGAYPAASVELRTRPTATTSTTAADGQQEDQSMDNEKTEAVEDRSEKTEAKVTSEPAPVLQVEDRAGTPTMRSLADEFRSRGFPGERATMEWGEYRSATFQGGTLTDLSPVRQDGVPLGHDSRWIYPAVPQVSVGSDVTSVQVLRQSSRTLLAGTAVVRDIDAVTTKPEVVTDTELATVELQQVAGIESDIPNILLEQNAIETLVETDLRLQHSEGLDSLILDAFTASGFQDPGSDELLVSIRRAAGTIEASGYSPNTLVLDPANAITLDTLTRGTADANDYVYGAGVAAAAPFGLTVRVAKDVPAPVVFDSTAFGKLYSSPVTLSRFEEEAGQTNTSTVRLENHAAFGVERQAAAVRIAGS